MMRLAFPLAALAGLLAACTTATDVPDPTGARQVIVQCGTALIGLCGKRAEQECGSAYEVLEVNQGISANTMRVRCPRP